MSVSTMKKLIVITPSDCVDATVKKLVKLRCVDVRNAQDTESCEALERLNCDEQRAKCERNLQMLDKALPVMVKNSNRHGRLGDGRMKVSRDEFVMDGSYDKTLTVVKEINDNQSIIEEKKNKIITDKTQIEALTPWIDWGVNLSLEGTSMTEFVLGTLPAKSTMASVEDALSDILCCPEMVQEDDDAIYLSIICYKGEGDKAVKALTPLGFLKLNFKGVNHTPKKAIAIANEEISAFSQEIEKLEERIRELSSYVDDAETLYDIEATELITVKNKQKMVKTQNCAVLCGWISEDRTEKLAKALDNMDCAYGVDDPEEGEEPPVLLRNNAFASNFEWVVGMYSYPKYGTFDPTFIMSIFYFFIFGLMFADVGYGLLLVLGGFLIPKLMGMKDSMKRSFYMFGYCGISCVIMGVIFGGWFGDLPYAIMENLCGLENAKEAVPFFNGLWFNPLDDPMLFLVVSLAIGAVHLVTGMAVKFVILCKEGHVFDAIFDIGSWWVIFAGLGMLFLPVPSAAAWVVLGIGVLMIVLTHGRHEKNILMKFLKGLLGLYDVTSYASDLLSYSRILALGLAAGVIGQVINLIATMTGPSIAGYIMLVLVCLIGHVLNLAINVLGSFVHTSRLQYLEFFNKFFEDGGEQFKAEEPSEKYTIE